MNLSFALIVTLLILGYAVLFRHANDELNYCIYIIPGNPNVTDETLPYWHEHMIKNDPNISQALGKNPKMERMKAGKKMACSNSYKMYTAVELCLVSLLL